MPFDFVDKGCRSGYLRDRAVQGTFFEGMSVIECFELLFVLTIFRVMWPFECSHTTHIITPFFSSFLLLGNLYSCMFVRLFTSYL